VTSTAVRDKKIALTQRRIDEAMATRAKHLQHASRLDNEITRLGQELDWLNAMPVDDTAPTAHPTELTGD
jgi:hypothetical protein